MGDPHRYYGNLVTGREGSLQEIRRRFLSEPSSPQRLPGFRCRGSEVLGGTSVRDGSRTDEVRDTSVPGFKGGDDLWVWDKDKDRDSPSLTSNPLFLPF